MTRAATGVGREGASGPPGRNGQCESRYDEGTDVHSLRPGYFVSVQDSAVFRLTRMPGVREEYLSPEATSGKIPTLVVRHESKSSRLWDSLKVLLGPAKFSGPTVARGLLHRVALRRLNFRGPSFSSSFVLHCAAIALIVYMPLIVPAEITSRDVANAMPERIYYIPVHPKPQPLPRIAPAGAGARPMKGSVAGVPAREARCKAPSRWPRIPRALTTTARRLFSRIRRPKFT